MKQVFVVQLSNIYDYEVYYPFYSTIEGAEIRLAHLQELNPNLKGFSIITVNVE